MNEKELIDYSVHFHNENGEPYIIKLDKYETFKNLPRSSNRRAWGNISWINYWRALTGNYTNQMVCAHCGKAIFADVNDPKCTDFVRFYQLAGKTDITENDYQAMGAHIQFETNDEIYDGIYIVPLCRECNNLKTEEGYSLQEGSVICAEIGQTIME